MIQKAMKFTPEVLLSAPRRSAGIPTPLGDKVLHTTDIYSFKDHVKYSQLHVLDVRTGGSIILAQNEAISDFQWLDDKGEEFVCLRGEREGLTSVLVCKGKADSWPPPWARMHYVAGVIEAPASALKIVRLDGGEVGFVVAAQAGRDGGLFNEVKAPKVHSSGRIYGSLYARHWDRWETREKSALWYGKLSKDKHGKYEMSELTNILKNTGLESPIPVFGGTDNFDISHNAIIFTAKDPRLNPALNTKVNVYLVHMRSWEPKKLLSFPQRVLVPGLEGAASSPVISPDGNKAAFLCMQKNGYEADRNHICVLHDLYSSDSATAKILSVSSDEGAGWDRSPSAICFTPNSESILATAEDYGYSRLFMLRTETTGAVRPQMLTTTGYVSDCKPLRDGRIFISGSSLIDNSFYALVDPLMPPQQVDSTGSMIAWTNSNSNQGNKFGLSPQQVSSIWTPASNPKIRKEVHALVVKPSNFDPKKKYPVAYFIHGGPQGSWADNWSTRWNPAVFAEQGYVVIAPNPTGSTGYGQAFTDSIRGNWGGDPYHDIVNCFEWVSKNMPEADNDRAVALGASYGGYMINWIQGHPLGRKFKALVCHDGTFSTAGMLATEELYFPFHDFGGTPWYDPHFKSNPNPAPSPQGNLDGWRKWDPSSHLSHWSTPQLTIHSEKDFRIPVSDGLATFNVLQTRGVESQFLTFPDENHWVLKPENGLVWHRVVLNWCARFVGLPAFCEEDVEGVGFWGGVREEGEEMVEMEGQGKAET